MTNLAALTPAGMQNPRIKQYLAIKKNTKSNTENLTCLEGLWEIKTGLDAGLEFRAMLVCPELFRGDEARKVAERIVASGVHSYGLSEKVMRGIVDRDDPDGLAAIVKLPTYTWDDIKLREFNRLLVLDGLEIPGNVGTIIRCADSSGADGVVITNRRTRLSHPKLIHSSMGSLFTFPVIEAEVGEAVEWLKRNRFAIMTTDTDATVSYRAANYRRRVAMVMGSERYGIVKEWYNVQDVSVSIPMSGRVDSLNVGNAAVLMLYEAFSQQEPDRFA
jgi:TrmH family RNA methyltransferase